MSASSLSAIKSAWSGSSASASARAEQKPEHLVLAHHSAFKKGLGERCLIPEMAERYHAWQIGIFAYTDADLVTAITMTNIPEAVGIARGAEFSHPGRYILYSGDGRTPANRRHARKGNHGGGSGNGRLSRLFHDQLRPSDPFP